MSSVLLDTNILLWAAADSVRLPDAARAMLEDPRADLLFSPISIWEIVIKVARGRTDFQVDAHRIRRRLLDAGYSEIAVTCEHALAVSRLPPLHKDPFDRLLLAQAGVEDATLLTADAMLARYPGRIRLVG